MVLARPGLTGRPDARDRRRDRQRPRTRGGLKDAAFLTHQATERYYHCVLLVCSFYTPHVHNLGFLRTQAEGIDPRLFEVLPRETKADRSRFEKLKDAYVKARYSKHYWIAADELAWLGQGRGAGRGGRNDLLRADRRAGAERPRRLKRNGPRGRSFNCDRFGSCHSVRPLAIMAAGHILVISRGSARLSG